MKPYRVFLLVFIVVVGMASVFYFRSVGLQQHWFNFAVLILIVVIYLLPVMLFGANVLLRNSWIEVQQYTKSQISFDEITSCHSVYLFPWRLVIIRTSRPLPMKLLIAPDDMLASSSNAAATRISGAIKQHLKK